MGKEGKTFRNIIYDYHQQKFRIKKINKPNNILVKFTIDANGYLYIVL